MTAADGRLMLAAIAGIALAIILIVRGRLHPFVALLCGARFFHWPRSAGGLSAVDTAKAVQKGAGDILGNIGLVVACSAWPWAPCCNCPKGPRDWPG